MGHLLLLVACLTISVTSSTKIAIHPTFLDPLLTTFLQTLKVYKSQPNAVVFLLDESGSIKIERYKQVKLFTKLSVRNLLVSAEHSRVAIIPFSDYTREKANYIKNIEGNNMCTLIKVINNLDYVGRGTQTRLAMEAASEIFEQARPTSNKIIVLITDGHSNFGYSPVEAAKRMKRNGVIIFAIGVADVNVQEVEAVATSKNHVYILKDFSYIETVNTYLTESISDVSWDLVKDTSLCNNFCTNRTDCCDSQASCNCGTQSGWHQCACNAGYQGNGHRNNCFMCPRGTYKPSVGNEPCKPCPQHSVTFREGCISLTDCICEKGYQKHGDYCKAVECTQLKAPPGGILIPANCNNLFGSECTFQCKEGYCPHSCNSDGNLLFSPYRFTSLSRCCLDTGNWSGDDFHCEKMRCPVLDNPLYGKHNCSGSDFVFGTACSFECEDGYELTSPNHRECLMNGTWTGSEAKCTEVQCDPLKANLNLLVKPSHCTKKKMKFNSVCQYYCASGYTLTFEREVNDGINKCLANKTWSGEDYGISCKDISPPIIRCPKSITTVTDPFKATAIVRWNEPYAVDNVFVSGIERIKPSFLQIPYAFPIKTTTVVYEAYDSSGLSDTCSFTVTVIDKEPPQVLFCPKDIKVYHGKKTPIPITWKEPKFADNSGNWISSLSDRKSGDYFSLGEPTMISYNVTDPSGNMAFCNFTIKVRQYPCPELKVPENGIITCDNSQDGHLCSVFCKDGYEFPSSEKVPTIFQCGQKRIRRNQQMQWIPFKLEKPVVFKFPFPKCSKNKEWGTFNTSVQMNFTVDTCNAETLDNMRKKFIENLQFEGKEYERMACLENKSCGPENVNISCVSPQSKAERSIQSSHEKKTILMISFNIQTYHSSLNESLTNDSSMAQSTPSIQDIEAQVSKDVHEVFNMSSLPTPQVKYNVVCSIGQIKKDNSCEYPCTELELPENGMITCDDWRDGNICSVFCKDDYEFDLSQNISNIFRCVKKGFGQEKGIHWTFFELEKSEVFKFPLPECSDYPCPELKIPENGIITCDNLQNGHVCNVLCKDGYEFDLSQKVQSIFRCGQKGISRKNNIQWIPFKLEKLVEFKFPLPDCSRKEKRRALNSSVKMKFYVPTCDEYIVHEMRSKFTGSLKLDVNEYVGMTCPENKGCEPENINIICVSPPSKAKRSIQSSHKENAILMISFDVKTYPSRLNESLSSDTRTAQSNPLIQDIMTQVSEDVREVYNMSSLPTSEVKYDVVLICSIGQINTNDSCVNCPTGTYKDNISDTCIDCPSATYQDKESSLKCLPCPKDYTTFNSRAKSKKDCKAPCKPGTYSKTTYEPCVMCPFDTYQEYSYGKECFNCPTGSKTWRVGSNSSSDCSYPCNPGSYSDTGLEPCSLCEYGFYQNISQEKSCEPCPGNTSTDILGAKDSIQCKEINLCEDIHPCSNASTCIPIRNTYKCVCPYGLFGKHCEMYIDQCEPHTCSNNGTCVSSYGINKCICPEGFSGSSCEINIDDCKQGYCQNEGKCIDLINDYFCECQSGFTGPKCEININDCAVNPCLNEGICFDKIQDYKCCCPTRYAGKNCDVIVDLCSKISCLNDGVCESNETHATCICKTGFSGELCENNVDDCANYDCLNNGTCLDGIDKAVCDCPLMFTGSHCEQETTPEYFLSFENPITSNYVQLENTKLLYAITISFFMRSNYQNSDSYPTPVSYSYYDKERKLLVSNALTLFDINNMVLYLHGETLHTGIVANSDLNWHHYAVTWERNNGKWRFFVDGEAVSSGTRVGQKRYFYPGMFVLGQEQDSLGGTFSTSEAFVGDITEFNAWDYAMSKEEIKSISSYCGVVGNIVPWVKAINHINGTVTISKDMSICKAIGSCVSDNCHCLYSSRQTDDLCKHSVQNCNPNPCKNAQQCAIKEARFFCNCSAGYDGKFCELDKNECLLNNGNCTHLCTNTVGSYVCKCPKGMILSHDGVTCKDTSYCEMGGQVYLNGASWMSGCQTCSCKQGTVDCRIEECKTIKCSSEEKLIAFPGNCCPKCVLYSSCFILPKRTLALFDYSMIKFSIGCSHTMVEDCVNGLYSVRYKSSKVSTSENYLLIYDNCMKIQVSHTGTLLLNDNSVPASFKSEIFSIESSNETIDIISKSGLYIQWQTNGEIIIAVPAKTAHHTCGLCVN